MIKLVAFDLWKTLAYRDVNYGTTDKILEITGVDIPQDQFVKIFEQALQTKKWPSKFEAYQNLCQVMGLPTTDDNINLIMTIRDEAEKNIKVYDYTMSLLQQLHQLNYKTGLISNSSIFAVEYLKQKTNLLDYIDYPIFSFEIGAIKPDRKIFNELIKQSSLNPEEILMIGDKPADDVIPAQDIGLKAILFKNYDQLKKDLTVYSIYLT